MSLAITVNITCQFLRKFIDMAVILTAINISKNQSSKFIFTEILTINSFIL